MEFANRNHCILIQSGCELQTFHFIVEGGMLAASRTKAIQQSNYPAAIGHRSQSTCFLAIHKHLYYLTFFS